MNSGPGGNPFNELECGKFYARAMSSWSLLIAAQGLVLEGPRGLLGFKPNWSPDEHRSFFTAAEGWGLFLQQCAAQVQHERIEVRYGQLRLGNLVFQLAPDTAARQVEVTVNGLAQPAEFQQQDREVTVAFAQDVVVCAGQSLEVRIVS